MDAYLSQDKVLELDISDVSAGVSVATLPKTLYTGCNLG